MRELFVLRFFVCYLQHSSNPLWSIVTVLGLVGGVPWDETSRVADSSSKPADISVLVCFDTLGFMEVVKPAA